MNFSTFPRKGDLFSPLDFISKLVALVPRPRRHLVRYHGVLAPNARIRPSIVPAKHRRKKQTSTHQPHHTSAQDQPDLPIAPLSWAERLRRVFDIDILACPGCGGTLRVIADVTDPRVIQTILDHVLEGAARAPPAAHRVSTQ